MVERISNQYTNFINDVLDIILRTFFSLHMIRLSNAEISIYLAVTYYWPLSIPVFGKIKNLLAVETTGVTEFFWCNTASFAFSLCLVDSWSQSLLREMPRLIVLNSIKFKCHIANLYFINTEKYNVRPQRLRLLAQLNFNILTCEYTLWFTCFKNT